MLGYPGDSTIIYRRGTLGVSMFGGVSCGYPEGKPLKRASLPQPFHRVNEKHESLDLVAMVESSFRSGGFQAQKNGSHGFGDPWL